MNLTVPKLTMWDFTCPHTLSAGLRELGSFKVRAIARAGGTIRIASMVMVGVGIRIEIEER